MPTYAYAGTTCGHEFELVQSINDPAATECMQCGGPVRKVFHPVGVAFKGSGFYRTDSRAGAGAASSANGDTGASGSDKGSSGEAKPGGDKAATKGKDGTSSAGKDAASSTSSTSKTSSTPTSTASAKN